MSKTVQCDGCGRTFDKVSIKYHFKARWYSFLWDSQGGSFNPLDVCEECWGRLKDMCKKEEQMGENNIYKAVEKFLDECLIDEMSQNMAKNDQEYRLKVNVYMLKRVVQIILSEM